MRTCCGDGRCRDRDGNADVDNGDGIVGTDDNDGTGILDDDITRWLRNLKSRRIASEVESSFFREREGKGVRIVVLQIHWLWSSMGVSQ